MREMIVMGYHCMGQKKDIQTKYDKVPTRYFFQHSIFGSVHVANFELVIELVYLSRDIGSERYLVLE